MCCLRPSSSRSPKGLHRRGRRHRHRQRARVKASNIDEVLVRVVRHVLEQHPVLIHRACGREPERVSIRRRLGHLGTGQHARRTGPVVHHHRLAQPVADVLSIGARQRIGDAAGGVADHDTDGLARPCGLGARDVRHRAQHSRRRGGGNQETAMHGNGTGGRAGAPAIVGRNGAARCFARTYTGPSPIVRIPTSWNGRRLSGQLRSGIQSPWKPNGTRTGSSTTARGGPLKS